MSPTTTHLIAKVVPAPGFGTADSQSLPFSGVARRVNVFFSGSSLGESSLFTRVKFIPHKRVSNAASVLCVARPGNYRRNSDFNRNWDEDRDYNDEGPDESDILDSKYGTLFSSTPSKFQANAVPGQTEKEILEFFTRKVEPRLHERTAGKDVQMDETVKGEDNEFVESIMNLLRSGYFTRKGSKTIRSFKNWSAASGQKASSELLVNLLQPDRFTGKGSKTFGASKNGSAAFGQKAASGTQSEGRSWNHSISNMKEPKATPVIRPASSFRHGSPVPSVKNQPFYNSEDGDYDIEEKQQPELDEESESDEEFESEQDLEPRPISSLDEYIFSDMAKDERSEEENSLDEGDQQPAEHEDLGSLKLAELRELAKSRGMKGFSKMKKTELVELLSGN